MAKYDFETVVRRENVGSGKWDEIRETLGYYPSDVIPFSVADMEFELQPEIRDGLKEYLDTHILGYAKMTSEYRNAVVNWMRKRHGWEIEPEWIQDTQGVINAFFTAVKTFTEEGDGVMLMTPVYYPMYFAITRNNRRLIENKLILKDGSYQIDFDDFERKAKDPGTRLLILCSPHNPSGRVWAREELLKIGEICIRNDVLIVSDEIHSDIVMPGYRHIPFASINDEFADRSIICTAPSKTFNLAGLQTSNIIIKNPEIRNKFLEGLQKDDGNPKCNIIGLETCRLAYTQCEEWLSGALKVINHNRETVVHFFEKEFPDIKVTRLEGTYLLWIDFRSMKMESKDLTEILHKEAFLFFDDGSVFGEAGEGFQRWNLACPASYIDNAIIRLRAVLKKYGKK